MDIATSVAVEAGKAIEDTFEQMRGFLYKGDIDMYLSYLNSDFVLFLNS